MKAYVFSIGEKTTDLCCELMKDYGFEVILLKDKNTTLWDKLKYFYEQALKTNDEYFVRIDADIIPNSNIKTLTNEKISPWVCSTGYDWYKQDRGAISIHLMHRFMIYGCLYYINEAEQEVRPETYLWRKPLINQFTYIENSYSCGIHGYGQADQRERIKKLKKSRDQKYDWSLIEKIEQL